MDERGRRRDRRRWAILCAVLVAAVAIVVGAGTLLLRPNDGGQSSPTSTPTPAVVATPKTTPSPSSTPRPVTIDWWQVDAGETGNDLWRSAAEQYMAAHPGVTITITLKANEPTEIDRVVGELKVADNAGNLPDLLPSWGGGMLAAEAEAGLLQDVTSRVSSWATELHPAAMKMHAYRGRQYAIPWEMGLFGFWYNKSLFARAGIVAPPRTWDEFLADVRRLKAANIVPYALGERDGWTGLHLWTYLVLREGGAAALTQMLESRDWNTPACVAGGSRVRQLVALNPFQKGYMTAGYNDSGTSEAATMGNGRAAMELMGPWAETLQRSASTSGGGIGDQLGWFPFPAVTGGKGASTDGVGGGQGIAFGRDAPPEAIDFVRFLVGKDVAARVGSLGLGLPVTIGTSTSVTDPLQATVLAARDQAGFVQLYVDQAQVPAVNAAMIAAVARLFDRKATPEQVCRSITQAVAG